MLRLGLLASGHVAGVSAGDAAAFALRDVSAFCRYISEERMNQHTKSSQTVWQRREMKKNLKLASVASAAAVAVR